MDVDEGFWQAIDEAEEKVIGKSRSSAGVAAESKGTLPRAHAIQGTGQSDDGWPAPVNNIIELEDSSDENSSPHLNGGRPPARVVETIDLSD